MKKWSRFFFTVVLCLVIIIYEQLAVLASCEITEGSDENQFITEFTDGNSDAVGETVPDQNDDADVFPTLGSDPIKMAPFGYSCTVTLQIRQTGKRLSGKLGSVYVSGG